MRSVMRPTIQVSAGITNYIMGFLQTFFLVNFFMLFVMAVHSPQLVQNLFKGNSIFDHSDIQYYFVTVIIASACINSLRILNTFSIKNFRTSSVKSGEDSFSQSGN